MCQVVFVPLAFVCVCICVSVLFPAAAFRRSGSAGQGQGMYRRRNMHTHTQAHTQSQRHRPTYARRQQHVVSGNVVPWQGVRAASSVATSKAQNSRLLSSSSWQLRLSCRCSAYMHFWSSKMRFLQRVRQGCIPARKCFFVSSQTDVAGLMWQMFFVRGVFRQEGRVLVCVCVVRQLAGRCWVDTHGAGCI